MMRWHRVLTILLVAAILGAIGTLIYVIAVPKVGEKFTEFYILGLEGTAEDYPEELELGKLGEVILGIVNQEHETTSYKIEVWIGDEQVNIWLDEVELEAIEIAQLVYEEKWEHEIGFTASEPCGSTTLSASVTQDQNTLVVSGIDNFEVNDYIQIGSSDDENYESAEIESINITNSEITINTELKYDHNEGETVIEKQKVEFRLFKDEGDAPYLTTHLYIYVS